MHGARCGVGRATEKWRPAAADWWHWHPHINHGRRRHCSASVWRPRPSHCSPQRRPHAGNPWSCGSGNSRRATGRAPDVDQPNDGFFASVVRRWSLRDEHQSAVITSKTSLNQLTCWPRFMYCSCQGAAQTSGGI